MAKLTVLRFIIVAYIILGVKFRPPKMCFILNMYLNENCALCELILHCIKLNKHLSVTHTSLKICQQLSNLMNFDTMCINK